MPHVPIYTRTSTQTLDNHPLPQIIMAMATLKLMPATTINGTTYAAQLILTPASPERKLTTTKTILPKQEVSPATSCDGNSYTSPPDFLRICQNKKSENAKRRIHFSKKALNHPRPQSVTRRNTRERNRVKAVNQGFVTLANHVPPHLRSKKMSKVDTLRAAISYIQDLQEALENEDFMMPSPIDTPTLSDIPSSPATSTSSSETSSSSHSCQPASPVYRTPDLTCHTIQPDFSQTTQQFSHYQPQLHNYTHNMVEQLPANTNYCQPQYTQNYEIYNQMPSRYAESFHIDFSRPYSTDTCPSPTSSCYTNSDYEQITPEVESEILEFASWLH